MQVRVAMTGIALVILSLSVVPVPQAQTTFASPVPNLRTWLPAYRVNYASPRTSIKKGLANTLHSGAHPEDAIAVGASWEYFWWNQAPVAEGVESVPMIDSLNEVGGPINGNSDWIMGFNEPDLTNATLGQVAMAWHAIEQSYPDKLLLSPAPSHLHPEWMLDFIETYVEQYGRLPKLDALAVHCYLSESQCKWRVRQFEDLANELGISQVWVTEFAFDNPSDTETFVRWMEAEPMIARYAIFVNRPDNGMWQQWAILNDNGALTDIGQRYRNLP